MHTFHIEAMRCGGCARRITAALTHADAHAQVAVDVDAKRVAVQSVLTADALTQVLADAGYAASAVSPTAAAAGATARRGCCA